MRLKILAFQPWDGGSHRAVRESIARHSRHDWDWVCLEPHRPRWRLRLGAAELVQRAAGEGALQGDCHALFTTSMTDAAQLRGLLPAHLAARPLVLYMHENQVVYPASEHVRGIDRERDAHLVATNIASMLAADLVLWNTAFNRDSFLEGAGELLAHGPERSMRNWVREIEERSAIAWPPVETIPDTVLRNPPEGSYADGVRVAWPHRWEHDKGPEELLALADEDAARLDLRFILLGERSKSIPPALEAFRARHGERIEHDGWVEDREHYLRILAGCDWVLSTARHEFFGIAVVEALMCGCLPWLPERLSYPEILPEVARGLSPGRPPGDPSMVVDAVRHHLDASSAPTAVGKIDDLMAGLGR